jgi:hypothetical protein
MDAEVFVATALRKRHAWTGCVPQNASLNAVSRPVAMTVAATSAVCVLSATIVKMASAVRTAPRLAVTINAVRTAVEANVASATPPCSVSMGNAKTNALPTARARSAATTGAAIHAVSVNSLAPIALMSSNALLCREVRALVIAVGLTRTGPVHAMLSVRLKAIAAQTFAKPARPINSTFALRGSML